LVLYDGEQLRAVATRGYPEEYAALIRKGVPPDHVSAFQRLRQGERVVHVRDAATLPLPSLPPVTRAAVEIGGVRTSLSIPLRREGALLGYISAQRGEVRPYSDQEIALLENFAAQAVIAMENARLLTETRDALEQQTATAEVLQVINSSPGDLAPVFDAILQKAHRLCDAPLGSLVLYDGERLRAVATKGYPQKYDALVRAGFTPTEFFKRLLRGEPFVHGDAQMIFLNREHPMRRAAVEIAGIQTVLFVPLRKDVAAVLGCISAQRQEVRPFTDKQIALLQSFAVQAVIAMENARLLGELRARTTDLEQSLKYQTATSDVLQVISRSTFDLQPVLDTLVATAARLCSADGAGIATRDGDVYRVIASYGATPEWNAFIRTVSLRPGRDTITGRALLERRVVQTADVTIDPEYRYPEAEALGNIRTNLGVPLLREGEPIGVMQLSRYHVEPFNERQIELLRTFADQAVIAIENARLLGNCGNGPMR
jgi:two-component system NtrC family sensor kinase